MRAIVCRELTGYRNLELVDLPAPPLGRGEVRIGVESAAVGFVEHLITQGLYQHRAAPPFVPGGYAAGLVLEVGAGVTSVRPGDRVSAFNYVGGYAEEMVVPELRCVPLPDAVGYDVGASYRSPYGTALYGLEARGRLRSGETLAVSGASGGVGLAAIDVGKALGARVIACVGSEAKAAVARRHGADETVDYGREPLKEALRALTDGRGADVIFDVVGGDAFDAALRAIAWGGRLLVVGFASGRIPEAPANLPLLRGAEIVGVSFGSWNDREPEAARAHNARLAQWIAEGRLHPLVSERFPLERAPEAIARVAERRAVGKVVVRVRES